MYRLTVHVNQKDPKKRSITTLSFNGLKNQHEIDSKLGEVRRNDNNYVIQTYMNGPKQGEEKYHVSFQKSTLTKSKKNGK